MEVKKSPQADLENKKNIFVSSTFDFTDDIGCYAGFRRQSSQSSPQ